MIVLALFFALLASLVAQSHTNHRLDKSPGKPNWKIGSPAAASKSSVDTMIENKNVNIIVNVDPKEVAKELWNLIESHLDGRDTRRSSGLPHKFAMNELERIVTPMIQTSDTRRNNRDYNPPSAFEVAYALDHVTRRALVGDELSRATTIDDEIDTREIVARMLYKLKTIMKTDKSTVKIDSAPGTRRSANNGQYACPKCSEETSGVVEDGNTWDSEENGNNNFVRIILNLRKDAVLQGNVIYTDKI